MNDSTKPIIFGVLVGLPTMLVVWIFALYVFGCGGNACDGIALPELTPIPTLVPATFPAPKVGAEAVPLKPRCQVAAVDLIGAWVNAGYSETETFTFTDVNSQNCTANFKEDIQPLLVTPNLWFDGSPACTTCHNADLAKSQKNMDLSSYTGILAGSNRKDGQPKGDDILGGGNWEKSLLHNMLFAPEGKTTINRPAMPLNRPAIVPAKGPVISAGSPPAPATDEATATPAPSPSPTP